MLIEVKIDAQLNFTGKFDPRLKTIQLDDGNYKFYRYDKLEKTVLLRNLDNTVWKSIKLPIPEDHLLSKIHQISVNLFNSDDKIEIVYSSLVYHPRKDPEDPLEGEVEKEITLNIINENGHKILEIKNSNDFEILDTNQGKKLLIYKHQGNKRKDKPETLVYTF